MYFTWVLLGFFCLSLNHIFYSTNIIWQLLVLFTFLLCRLKEFLTSITMERCFNARPCFACRAHTQRHTCTRTIHIPVNGFTLFHWMTGGGYVKDSNAPAKAVKNKTANYQIWSKNQLCKCLREETYSALNANRNVLLWQIVSLVLRKQGSIISKDYLWRWSFLQCMMMMMMMV